MNWQKCPSVRAGGKPYFYVTFTDKGKITVVWSRLEEKWGVYRDKEKPEGEANLLGLFATAKEGMAFAEAQ